MPSERSAGFVEQFPAVASARAEISIELAMGVIAKLLPEDAQTGMIVASQQARRWAH